MKEFDIVLLTEDRFDRPKLITPYIQNILSEDELLAAALRKRNLRVTRKSWSDPDFNWASAHFALFRTTWDYFNRYDKFQSWLNATEKKTRFINPIELVRWNMDKHYLQDLQNRGIRTVDALFIEKGSTQPLREFCERCGWNQLILKPAVSGAARHTYLLNEKTIDAHEEIFAKLIANESMLLQPFQHNIIDMGEVAFMVIGGKFSHAVLKKARQGDFRVQDDFGGTLHEYHPSEKEIQFALEAIGTCFPKPVYARVDIVINNQGSPAIMELELIEPELWFRRNPPAAELLADELLDLF